MMYTQDNVSFVYFPVVPVGKWKHANKQSN